MEIRAGAGETPCSPSPASTDEEEDAGQCSWAQCCCKAGHGHESHTQTRQGLTDPNPAHGTGPVALWHLAGHSPGDPAGMPGRGLVAGARRLHSPYLAEQVGQDNVRQRAGEARELWREHRELLYCPGCLLYQEATRTARRGRGRAHLGSCPVNPAFAIGVDVHKDQPFDQVRENELQ